MKVLTVVGARPQFIKAAMVSRALEEEAIKEIILHTGQHFDHNMSAQFFDELEIPEPRYNLGVGGGTHAQNTGRALEGIEQAIVIEAPDFVVVYGDTDSTLAGALAAAKLNVPVAHVEAGLRSYNRRMPEEINRVLVDHVSQWLLAPTENAISNLTAEGIEVGRIRLTGDVMLDAVEYFASLASRKSRILREYDLEPKQYILATVHRKENTDDPLRLNEIIQAFSCSPLEVILPIHPRTRKRMVEASLRVPERVRMIEPVGYLDMLQLQSNAFLIATDSGGIQKEAYFNGVPAIVLRDETEWIELVECGYNKLVGADPEKIKVALNESLPPRPDKALYGDGCAAGKIAKILKGN